MLITKAEVVGRDLHIRCACMKEDEPDTVYGTNAVFTPRRAAQEFSLNHEAMHRPSPTPSQVPGIVGMDTASLASV